MSRPTTAGFDFGDEEGFDEDVFNRQFHAGPHNITTTILPISLSAQLKLQ
jgi:hypothetical protein